MSESEPAYIAEDPQTSAVLAAAVLAVRAMLTPALPPGAPLSEETYDLTYSSMTRLMVREPIDILDDDDGVIDDTPGVHIWASLTADYQSYIAGIRSLDASYKTATIIKAANADEMGRLVAEHPAVNATAHEVAVIAAVHLVCNHKQDA